MKRAKSTAIISAVFALNALLNSSVFAEEIQATLIRGTPANLADYPASVRAGGCTATVVGERTLFT